MVLRYQGAYSMNKLILTVFTGVSLLGFVATSQADKKVSPTTVTGAKTVNAAEAKVLFDKGTIFIDTRKDKDWNAGRIPDAIHLDVKKKLSEATLSKDVKKSDPVVMYCNGSSCIRSSKASKMAVDWGYTNVYYFRDGFPAWKAAGYPVE